MHIDCDTCSIRGAGCAGCVITLLMGAPPVGVPGESSEQADGSDQGVVYATGYEGYSGVDTAGRELDRVERTALRVLADAGLIRRHGALVTHSSVRTAQRQPARAG